MHMNYNPCCHYQWDYPYPCTIYHNWDNRNWSFNGYPFHYNPYHYIPYDARIELQDYGPNPFVVNIEQATKQNQTFRTALWTGRNLQVTLMSIEAGDDIGLEVHPQNDQFIRIEEGQGIVRMGDRKEHMDFEQQVYDDFAIMIPAGKWHNIINTGNKPLKVYAIYAPPEHPFGTVHETKAIAMASE